MPNIFWTKFWIPAIVDASRRHVFWVVICQNFERIEMLFDVSKEKRTCLLLLLIQSLPHEDSSLGVVIFVQNLFCHFSIFEYQKSSWYHNFTSPSLLKNKHKLAKRAALHFLYLKADAFIEGNYRPHTIYTRNNMDQKCEGNCGLWVLNEMI